MKNITLSAHEELIERARVKAQLEKTTLNAVFRKWLESYVGKIARADQFLSLIERHHTVSHDGPLLNREERNER